MVEVGQAELQAHQLDFDWRFSPPTISRIANLGAAHDGILLLGCPALVDAFEQQGQHGLLVERNPNHKPSSRFEVLHTDLRFEVASIGSQRQYGMSVVDPPWYPNELLRWLDVALSWTALDGPVLFTLWPDNVRPLAKFEHTQIFQTLQNVGTVERLGNVHYELPLFEAATLRAIDSSPPQREGWLFKLTKQSEHRLSVPLFERGESKWVRFTISGEQVAIKISSEEIGIDRSLLFEKGPFVLTSTSRRDAILPRINIWTSQNVVGRLASPITVVKGIERREDSCLRMLVEKMGMTFDPEKIDWGRSWQHPA